MREQLLAADIHQWRRKFDNRPSLIAERLAQLQRHLDHLRQLRTRVMRLGSDLSLRNDVLFSLLMICQIVIDISAELSAERGQRFETPREAIQNLARVPRFPADLVNALDSMPRLRNLLVHNSRTLDANVMGQALDNLDPVEKFMKIVARGLKPPATPDPENS